MGASVPVLDVAAQPPPAEEVVKEFLNEAELVGSQGGKTAVVVLEQPGKSLELLLGLV